MINISHNDESTLARCGTLSLPHGTLPIPNFMPVGTNGTVKGITHKDIEDMGTKLILANTYHLYLRPGIELIKKAGGLHQFSGWKHNILTDSGGYQVFSLAPFRKITPEGVKFRSHIDGSYHFLTPESVVELQEGFNSDIMMPLDVCTGPNITYREAEEALKTTTNWAKRSKEQWNKKSETYKGQLFGIIQGNFYEDLRKRSAEEINEIDTPGIAIGGLSVGETFSQYQDFLQLLAPMLPANKPHYVMGIGTPEFILEAVAQGIDIFDCVYPTRIARNGSALTPNGVLDLVKNRVKEDFSPIQEQCTCHACSNYSRAYIRHLFKCKEMLGPMLVTNHNLHFLNQFMSNMRLSIMENRFSAFKNTFLTNFKGKHNE